MRPQTFLPLLRRNRIDLLVLIFLLLALTACQTGAPTAAPDGTSNLPVEDPSSPASGTIPTAADDKPEGGVDLADPSVGIDQFTGYRQVFSLTLNGALQGSPYEESQTLTRQVAGGDESLLVNEGGTGKDSLYLVNTRLGDYRYTQERENAPCRAEPVDPGQAADLNPALRLPAVFGMQKAGPEAVEGQPAIQYTFDQRSLYDPEGQVERAAGVVWLAEESGVVLKYELTAEIIAEGFTGARTWAYQLTPLNAEPPISLPASCQVVPADLPVMPKAADVDLLPGFQRYSVRAARSEAVEFYFEQLSDREWQALPGSAPETADLTSAATVLSFAQPYQEGSRVVVIHLSEQAGQLQVIAQTALTKAPVETDINPELGEQSVENGEETEPELPGEIETTPVTEPPGGKTTLPADVPTFPGATVISEMEGFRMLETSARAYDVTRYYTEELKRLGWTLSDKVENAGITFLMWSRNGQSLTVTVSAVGTGGTQVLLSASGE